MKWKIVFRHNTRFCTFTCVQTCAAQRKGRTQRLIIQWHLSHFMWRLSSQSLAKLFKKERRKNLSTTQHHMHWIVLIETDIVGLRLLKRKVCNYHRCYDEKLCTFIRLTLNRWKEYRIAEAWVCACLIRSYHWAFPRITCAFNISNNERGKKNKKWNVESLSMCLMFFISLPVEIVYIRSCLDFVLFLSILNLTLLFNQFD